MSDRRGVKGKYWRAPASLLAQNITSTLIARRLRLGWTQAQLAETAGVSKQRISQIERGFHNSQMATVIVMARAMGMMVRLIEVDCAPESAGAPAKYGARFDKRSIAAQLALRAA